MKRILSITSAIGDRVNPIVIKELRQAVRSRLIMAILLLFLGVNIVAIGLSVMLDNDVQTSSTAGRDIFFILLIILSVTCVMVVPLYSSIRLSLERNDSNVDLLFITTLKPGMIVRGKFLASMAVTLMILSCCLPFLSITFLLRGIDLPTIFFVMVWVLLIASEASMFGVFLGTIFSGWFIRVFLWLVLLGALCFAMAGAMSVSAAVRFGETLLPRTLEQWAGYGTGLLVGLLIIGFFYVLSVACLSAPASNRSMPLRIYVTAVWIIIGVMFVFWSLAVNDLIFITVWMCGTVGLMMASMFIATAERDDWSPRVRRQIPKFFPLRVLAWLFYTGSSGGIAWCTLIALSTMGVCLDFLILNGSGAVSRYREVEMLATALEVMCGMYLYCLCYCLTAVLLRYWVFRAPLFLTPLIAGCIAVMANCLPQLIAFYAMGDRWRFERVPSVYILTSPLALEDRGEGGKALAWGFLIVSSIALTLASLPWTLKQWSRFRPLEQGEPDMAGPDTVGQDAARPDSVGPDTARPDTVGQDTARPDSVGPDTAGQ